MSRKLLNEAEVVVAPNEDLDALIPQYAFNKGELDSYKKICDEENSAIKALMLEAGTDEYTVGDYVAKRSIQHRESMNEARLLEMLKKHNVPAIKTVEVVDMDALENYLYNAEPNAELTADIASCKVTQEVVQLKVSTKKKKGV